MSTNYILLIVLVNQLVTIETDPYACCNQAHAFAVCTEWNEFQVRRL